MAPHPAPHWATHWRALATAALALASLQSPAADHSCESSSAAGRVSVLELYTSEGCDSCPPADRWVSSLPARGFTPDRLIPLAFHVDYWDRLGWPDRMAKAQFSARQRMQAKHVGIVYTPQLLLNGAEYRASSSDSSFGERIHAFNRLPAGADLSLRQRPVGSGVEVDLMMQLARPTPAHPAQTYVAITEDRLRSVVKAGENRGKVLQHDFVVRELAGPLPATDEAGRLRWKSALALAPDWKRTDLALVAFVQDAETGEILQALHAPLCTRP